MTPAPSGDARELVGQQLGVYQVEAPLTIGGQTDFFRARDLYTDQLVALKLLPATLSTGRDAVAHLREELRRIARLRHPHLLPVVEVGTERGLLYAIALLPADSLRGRFEREGLLSPQDAVRYAAELAWALHALHSAGLVHGDVQPGNMLFDGQAGLRLADFGVLRALQRQRSKERRTGVPSRPFATRSYIAPEVAQGGEMTPRSDIYSLGAVFYEMLIGTLPLVTPDGTPEGEEITTAPLPPSMRSSEDWPELAAVALKALAPDPARRYADARAFAVALRTAVFTQQREDQRPSLIAALSGVFHAPAEGAEATFIQRVTGAPAPSAPMPEAPPAAQLDPRHLAYRAAPPPMPDPIPPIPPFPRYPQEPAFAAPSTTPPPLSEDDVTTTLLDERLIARDAAVAAAAASFAPPPQPEWVGDDAETTLLNRRQLDSTPDSSPPLASASVPLPPPSVPPRHDFPPMTGSGEVDLAAAWLAALETTASPSSPSRPDDQDDLDDGPVTSEELVDDLRRLAGGPSRPVSRRSRSNPGWIKALLATLGITVLALATSFAILTSTHAPNAAPGGPAIPTATTAPANTTAAATPAPSPAATRSGDSRGSTFTFPTPTPIPPPPTAAPH